MSLELPYGIRLLNARANVDDRYGPHDSRENALLETEGTRVIGLTVLIGNVEYWFKEGVSDNDLVLKGDESIIKEVEDFCENKDPNDIFLTGLN